jgi:hypothetical protein
LCALHVSPMLGIMLPAQADLPIGGLGAMLANLDVGSVNARKHSASIDHGLCHGRWGSRTLARDNMIGCSTARRPWSPRNRTPRPIDRINELNSATLVAHKQLPRCQWSDLPIPGEPMRRISPFSLHSSGIHTTNTFTLRVPTLGQLVRSGLTTLWDPWRSVQRHAAWTLVRIRNGLKGDMIDV